MEDLSKIEEYERKLEEYEKEGYEVGEYKKRLEDIKGKIGEEKRTKKKKSKSIPAVLATVGIMIFLLIYIMGVLFWGW